ncbi:MAG: MFS transporter [Eggerthellaceae bacterium]|nr:MFS transporter [Eggerthellaceae bacterium]
MSNTWLGRVVAVWAGQAISILSAYAATYAGVWYITETTSSPAMLSLAAIVSLLPQAILSPFAGIIADKAKKKTVLVVADIFVLLLALIFSLFVAHGFLSVELILVFGVLRSIAESFHMPALESATPFLVPDKHLLRINTLNQGIWSFSLIVGPALGIFFFTLAGFQFVLLLNAAGVSIALLVLLFVKFPETHLSEKRDNQSNTKAFSISYVFGGLREGFNEIVTKKGLLLLGILVAIDMAIYISLDSFYPLMTYSHFSGSGYQASFVEAVYGITSLIGLAVLFVWQGGSNVMRLVGVCGVATGVLTFITAFLPNSAFYIFVLITGATGVFESLYTGPIMTIVQRHIDPTKLGRVMGLYTTITGLSSPLGLGIAGIATEHIGITSWFALAGIITTGIGCSILFLRQIQELGNR